MKNIFLILIVFCFFESAFYAVDNSSNDSIIIYGRESCGNCQALRKSLESNSVKYIFYDVDKDNAKNKEMWDKIAAVDKSKHSILLPVVDVNGNILIDNPTAFQKIKPYLNRLKLKNKKKSS